MDSQSVFKWTSVGDLLISCARGPTQNDVWETFLKELSTKPYTKLLATIAAPMEVSSVQRNAGYAAIKGKKLKVAVVTDEKVVRGMATAASWMGVDVKAFSWNELRAAISSLGLTGPTVDDAYDHTETLRRAVLKK